LRDSGSTLPIIVLSSRTDEAGKVRGTRPSGADGICHQGPSAWNEFGWRSLRAALRHRLQQQGGDEADLPALTILPLISCARVVTVQRALK